MFAWGRAHPLSLTAAPSHPYPPLSERLVEDQNEAIAKIVETCPPWIDWLTFDRCVTPGGLARVLAPLEGRWAACATWIRAFPSASAVPLAVLGLSVRNHLMDHKADMAALLSCIAVNHRVDKATAPKQGGLVQPVHVTLSACVLSAILGVTVLDSGQRVHFLLTMCLLLQRGSRSGVVQVVPPGWV